MFSNVRTADNLHSQDGYIGELPMLNVSNPMAERISMKLITSRAVVASPTTAVP